MKNKLLIPFLCVLFIFGCQPRNSLKNRLRLRVNQYYAYIIKREYSPAWDFLWHDAKRIRNRDEWTNLSRGLDSKSILLEFHIQSVSIYKFQKNVLGTAKIIGKHKIIKENKVENIKGDDNWIFENGDWFRHIENW
jgi:hypothetical protein